MKKNRIIILIAFMSMSLIGIIFLQAYWIKNSLEIYDKQFSQSTNSALVTVANAISDREMRDYLSVYQKLKDSIGEPVESQLIDVFQYVDKNRGDENIYLYYSAILEEDYKINSNLFDSRISDSISIKDYTSLKSTIIFDDAFEKEMNNMSSMEKLQMMEEISLIDEAKYKSIFIDIANLKPIANRVSNIEVQLLLQKEFKERGLPNDYDFKILNKKIETKLGTSRYENFDELSHHSVPLFANQIGETDYVLVVGFPMNITFINSNIIYLILLLLFFTFIIIFSFYSTIVISIKQKNISEMKSDFINNMTHEFKTPIATINLAIDAIKKKLMGKVDTKSMGYLNIIKDENKRMNNQVENVLMISQLEKEKIELEMKMMDLNKLVQLAIDRVELLSGSVGARITKKFDKKENIMMLAKEEMINVFVNILENSLKYSKSNPVIQIMVKNEKSNTIVFFKDNGIGMTKKIKTKIFEKFYRESKGNIHNIKGHGLGLAFVKKIIELHAGFISVQSQIGKGSTFKITLNNVNKT